ncbi:MAG: hypothetical protein ACFE9A_20870, partial [Candidatus Hodarchaeota archaeon]
VEVLPDNELLAVLNLQVKSIIIAFSTEVSDSIKTKFIERLQTLFNDLEIYQKQQNERDTFIKERIIGKKFWMKEFDGMYNCITLVEKLLAGGSLEKTVDILYRELGVQSNKPKSDVKAKKVTLIDFLDEADDAMKPLSAKDKEKLRGMM